MGQIIQFYDYRFPTLYDVVQYVSMMDFMGIDRENAITHLEYALTIAGDKFDRVKNIIDRLKNV